VPVTVKRWRDLDELFSWLSSVPESRGVRSAEDLSELVRAGAYDEDPEVRRWANLWRYYRTEALRSACRGAALMQSPAQYGVLAERVECWTLETRAASGRPFLMLTA